MRRTTSGNTWLQLNMTTSKTEQISYPSEEHLRVFFEHAPVALAMFDRDMCYLAASKRWIADFNLDENRIPGLSHYEAFPEIPDRWRDIHRRGLAGETLRAEEDLFVRANGTKQWLRWEVRPWHDRAGAVGGLLIFSEDITARKLAEGKLIASELKYRSLHETMRDAFALIDLRGNICECNSAFVTMLGYPEAELKAMTYFDLTPALWHEAERHILEEQVLVRGFSEMYEKEYRKKDGTVFPVELCAFLIRNEAGDPWQIGAIVRDLSERKRNEANIRSSEERLHLALQGARGGAWDWDLKTGLAWWSPEMYDLWGVDPNTSMNLKTSLDVVSPLDRDRLIATTREAVATGTDYRCEFRIWHHRLGERWMDSFGKTIFDETGHAIRMIGMSHDITTRKRAEEEREVFVQVLAGINQSKSVEELIDATCVTLRTWLACEHVRIVEQHAPCGPSPLLGPLPAGFSQTPAGTRWTNTPTSAAFVRLHAADALQGVLKITDGNRALFSPEIIATLERLADSIAIGLAHKVGQKLIGESEKRYRTVFESSNDAIFIGAISSEGDLGPFVEANSKACSRLGWSRDELLHMTPYDIDPVFSRDRGRPFVQRALRGEVIVFETSHRNRNGELLPIEVSSQVIDWGGERRILSITRDIAERKKAEESMRRAIGMAEAAARTKAEFLANMSHEIRTPMNGILGMTELALGTALSEEQRDYLQSIRDSSSLLLAIINDILDFSKIDAGKLELHLKPYRFRNFLDRTLSIIKPTAERKDLHFVLEVDDSIPEVVVGDEVRLSQVLLNLVGNAIKFTGAGAVMLRIKRAPEPLAEQHQTRILFSIIDTGIGVPADFVPRLAEPFSQADASSTRSFGGTGLGLSISKRLIELMGGQLTVRSREGLGSAFHFSVILGTESASSESAPEPTELSTEPAPASPSANAAVLLVEDNATNQKLVMLLLQKSGLRVTLAQDGEEALQILGTGACFDAVLMDIQMPRLDGYEATRRIRQAEALTGEHLPIIALTAHALEGDDRKCLEAGMDDYLAKPIGKAKLLSTIAKWTVKRVTNSPA